MKIYELTVNDSVITVPYPCTDTNNVHGIQNFNWATGFSRWTFAIGGGGGAVYSQDMVLHPTLEYFCGYVAATTSRFDTTNNCDLDPTDNVNIGDPDPSPGNPIDAYSMFAFCYNVSSQSNYTTPVWTHTISSSNMAGIDSLCCFNNAWAGSDMLIQGVVRWQVGGNNQGLVWPATGLRKN